MRFTGLLIGFVALALLLPTLTAQEKKGDKKDPDKADTEKPEKPVKPKKKVEEKLEHGAVIQSRLLSFRPDSARDFTIEVPMPDPQQQYQLQVWQAQQMASIAQSRNPLQYVQRMQQYQMQLAQRMASGAGYTKKPVDVRAGENCKVRSLTPPVEYDDAGNLKKWTKADLAKKRGTSKLPGFPVDFDALKPGQFVQVYFAKQHGSPKDNKWRPPQRQQKKKKEIEEDPPEPMPEMRPEVVMILILGEPPR